MKEFIDAILEIFGFEDGILLYLLRVCVFYYFSAWITIVVHEMGHYIAAKLCKKEDIRVRFGYGPGITIGKATFCIYPFGGLTRYKNVEEKNIAIMSAGIAAQMILELCLSFVMNPFVILFRFINLIAVVENLLPIKGHDGYVIAYLISQKLTGKV